METRKNPSQDLTRKTGMFFNLGLVIALMLVLMAFEWRFTATETIVTARDLMDHQAIEMVPPTVQPPPPPPPNVQHPNLIEIPEDEEIEVDIPFDIDVEVTEETRLEAYVPLDNVTDEPSEEVFVVVEERPTFKGGDEAKFLEFIARRLKYPDQARRMGIEGKVFVEFIVDKSGRLIDIKVLKGIGAGCDQEAVQAVSASPIWQPGKQRGQPVNVKMVLPFSFKLAD
ncbi:MAG: energy transducer TonB [Candidatus Cyclobacteriaceae bacterium M3_2C_046]